MKWADELEDKDAKSITQSKLKDFEENWDQIEKIAKQKSLNYKKD